MTAEVQNNQQPEQKQNDKEYNFRQLEAKRIEAERRAIEAERRAIEAERMAKEALTKKQQEVEEEDTDEPYVDHKKLSRQLASFEKKLEEKIERKAEEKARTLLEEEKKNDWIKRNPDFYDVLQHAEKFAVDEPELAETLLEMPNNFSRQKLVYKNVKKYLEKVEEKKKPSIQDTINNPKKGYYYQPSGMAAAPYNGTGGDYSQSGQKSAYDKMQQLKAQLRL